MILSVSRRTDIPAFYADWWYRRVEEGFVLVPSPYDPGRISRVSLSPAAVDCIVFWSKDPAPMLPRLPELDAKGYLYYFSFTITGAGAALEPGAPDTAAAVDTFRALSGLLGPARVDWRFDPILLGGERTPERVAEQFARLCAQLAPLTTRCILSFADPYVHLDKGLPPPPDDAQIEATAALLAPIAERCGLPLFTCAERADLSRFGIKKVPASIRKRSRICWGARSRPSRTRGSAKRAAHSKRGRGRLRHLPRRLPVLLRHRASRRGAAPLCGPTTQPPPC